MVTEFSLAGTSLLHRLDPRAKVAGLAAMVPAFFVFPSPWLPGVYSVGLGLLFVLCLGWRELGRSAATVGPVLLIACILTPLFRRTGYPVLSLFGFPIVTSTGLEESARIAGRLSGLTFAFYLVFRTTPVEDFMLTLRWYGLPFVVVLPVTIAFRFVPTLAALYRNVQDAHALRRTSEDRGRGLARYVPLLTSLFVQSIRMIPALAMALETRGFGRRNRRSEWRVLGGRKDLVVSFLPVCALCALVYSPLFL